jgi:hypothetical protein
MPDKDDRLDRRRGRRRAQPQRQGNQGPCRRLSLVVHPRFSVQDPSSFARLTFAQHGLDGNRHGGALRQFDARNQARNQDCLPPVPSS